VGLIGNLRHPPFLAKLGDVLKRRAIISLSKGCSIFSMPCFILKPQRVESDWVENQGQIWDFSTSFAKNMEG